MRGELRAISAAVAALATGLVSAQPAEVKSQEKPAIAEQQTVAKDTGNDAPKTLEANQNQDTTTVTVTAARARTAPVSSGALGTRSDLETPFSTRLVDAVDLEERQVKALGQVFAEDSAVMSLGDTYSFNAYSINVRGIALDDYNGYKINGLPFFMTTVELPIESFDSIQLLKGASGFMYGFGAPGGIINFITKKPTDTRTLSVDVGYHSDGVFSEHVDAGGRAGVDDRFGYRLNLTHEQGDTYNGSHVLRNSASLSVDARLTSALTWTADAIYQAREVKGGVQDFMLDSYTDTALPKAVSGRKNLSSYADTFFDSDVYFLSSGLHWQIAPDWKANVDVSTSQDWRKYSGQWLDLANSAGDYSVYLNRSKGRADYEQSQATIEGKFSTGGIQHQVVFGAAWQGLIKHTVPHSLYTDIGDENLYVANTPLTWNGTFDYSLQYRNFVSTQKSLFASDTLQLFDKWSLLAGLRYNDYTQSSYTAAGVETSYTKKPVTPTIALMFRPSQQALVYASFVEALEDGGTVGTGYTNAEEVLSPIKSKQIEFGTKFDEKNWGASAALYQINHGAEYGNADNVYVSNGQVRIRGLELNGHVDLPAGVQASASTTWSTGIYKDTEADLVGKHVEGLPRLQGVLQVSEHIPGVEALTASAEAHYFEHMAADANNKFVLPSYTLFNLGLTYKTRLGQSKVTLRAGLDNVFNKNYWGFLASDYLYVGTPRTLGLNARFEL